MGLLEGEAEVLSGLKENELDESADMSLVQELQNGKFSIKQDEVTQLGCRMVAEIHRFWMFFSSWLPSQSCFPKMTLRSAVFIIMTFPRLVIK